VRGVVLRDNWPPLAPRHARNQARNPLLAGPRLAAQEHSRLCFGHVRRAFQHGAPLPRAPDDARMLGSGAKPPGHVLNARFQALSLTRRLGQPINICPRRSGNVIVSRSWGSIVLAISDTFAKTVRMSRTSAMVRSSCAEPSATVYSAIVTIRISPDTVVVCRCSRSQE